MKNFISKFTVIITSMILVISCTDLSDINQRLDEHENRLNNLEHLVSTANSKIQNLQKLIDAESQKISIVSYEKTDMGYVLKMSDGSTINLKNGQDGNSPVISVKDIDGILYWTINGNLMKDANGNNIKAEGQDGTNGSTPKIKVNTDGYWEVSLDNGVTWEVMTDENGDKVKAVGQDATVDLEIIEDEYNITIIYDGKTFVIPIKKKDTPDEPTEKQTPLEYIAEYDINISGEDFITTHDYTLSGFFTWAEAIDKFSDIQINGIKYHLPSIEEWKAIFPLTFNWGYTIARDEIEVIKFKGVTKTYKAEYYAVGENLGYGIKFIGDDNSERIAFRYETITDEETNSDYLKVTNRFIGKDVTISRVEDISNEEWWSTSVKADPYRIFTAGGVRLANGEIIFTETDGNYWSSSKDEYIDDFILGFTFDPSGIKLNNGSAPDEGKKIRLFMQ